MENPVAAAENDKDILGHLLEVESDASSLALEASEEADKRRSAAKQKADSEYRAKYEEMINSLDAWLNSEKEKNDTALKAVFAEYDERLKALPKDIDSFYSFVDSLLAGN